MRSTLTRKSLLLREQIVSINHIALRTGKTQWSFGHSECNRVKFLFLGGKIENGRVTAYDSVAIHFQAHSAESP